MGILGIILLILKIIGLILLWALIIILALILYFLIFPFHYEVSVRKFEDIGFNVKINTFLYSIAAGADKEDGGEITPFLRILWGLLKILPKKEKPDIEETPETEDKFPEEVTEESIKEEPAPEIKDETINEVSEEKPKTEAETSEENPKAETQSTETGDKKEPESTEVAKKPESESTEEKPEEEKEDDKLEKIEKIKDLLLDPDTLEVMKIALSNVAWLLKGYMPKKFYADFEFSAGTPDGTGEILAFIAVLPMFQRNKGKVVPDFMSEDPFFKGTVSLKGNVQIGRIFGMIFRIMAHKETINLIKKILGGKKNGKVK